MIYQKLTKISIRRVIKFNKTYVYSVKSSSLVVSTLKGGVQYPPLKLKTKTLFKKDLDESYYHHLIMHIR